ncbi:hypothetical protein U0070_014475 [Myodes glareolus]|uniref:Serine and arginine rich splicing factor 7 n=1 Tax=Myodes glareolus TaxID=447135 RepID=A0AAW0J4F4_MYOGA
MSRYGRYGGAVWSVAASASGAGIGVCLRLLWKTGTETKVYVGNLGTGAGKGELERAFSYYGPLRTVWIARNPPGFAFVEFEDPRDAEDAVRGLDGKVICGSRVRVELSTGMPRRSRFDRPPARRPFDPNDRCYECGEKGHYAYDCHRYSRRRRSRYLIDKGMVKISISSKIKIPFKVEIKIQVYFTAKKQSFPIRKSTEKCKS